MKYAQAQELEEAHDEAAELYESFGEEAGHTEFEEQTVIDQSISGGIVLISVIALVVAFRLYNEFGGKLRTATTLFTLGILVNLVATFWGSFVAHRVALGTSSFDTHNVFMAVSTLLFLAAIKKFTRLIPRSL